MEVLSAGQRGEWEYILIRNKDEAPGGHRRSPEAREGRRKPQEAPGGPQRGPRGAPSARQIGERKMCAAPQRECNFQKACARR